MMNCAWDKKIGKPRSTKDKYIVVPKMKLLEKLMLDYLDIEKKKTEETDVLKFEERMAVQWQKRRIFV